jgi:DNA polymerase III gamma/tau subunit
VYFARLILSKLQERSKKDALLRNRKDALELLQTIEEVHKSGRVPEGFEQRCKSFYEKIMSIIGESVLDDAVIASLSWERRVAEPIA